MKLAFHLPLVVATAWLFAASSHPTTAQLALAMGGTGAAPPGAPQATNTTSAATPSDLAPFGNFAAELAPPAQTLQQPTHLALLSPEPIPPPPGAFTADAVRLTLAEVEQLATSNHPALRAAEARVRAARGNWVQVGLLPNPTIGYQATEIGDDGRAGQQGGFISQEFVTAHKLGLNRAVAMREVAIAEQALERTRLQVLATARKRYYEALSAEHSVALARQLTEMATRAVTISELRLQALEGTRTALLQSQIERDSIVLLEEQAANRHQAAWRRLATLIGADGDGGAAPNLDDGLQRPLAKFEWEAIRDRVTRENPDLVRLQIEIERARWVLARAEAGRVPNFEVQAGAQYDSATEDTIAGVQVSLPLPMYNRNQGAIAQATAELAATRAAFEQQKLALEQRLAEAVGDYETLRQRVSTYTEAILPAARETLQMVAEGYQQGELEYLQVLTVQQTYTQKNVAYLQDLEAAWKKWAEIDGLLVGDLPETSN